MTGLIVTEWIEPAGGAERVLDRLAMLFPNADMLALWNDAPGRYPDRIVRETWLARTPLRRRKALALPVMPITWRIPRRRGHDWTLVSSHAFAHHVRAEAGAPKLVYAHTPARYLWAPELDARGDNLAARVAGPPLRAIDRRAAAGATALAANSRFVAERIARSWDREATVVHPPVDVAAIRSGAWRGDLTDSDRRVLDALPADFVLGVSRFIPYKRMDEVIAVGEALDRPVVIAGSGPLEAELRAAADAASVPVQVLVAPSDALVRALMERASLFVFPPVEDFGIVAVEAMAAGTPVMANRRGGAEESVVDGVSGALFDPRSAAETTAAADVCAGIPRDRVSTHAMRFDAEAFDSDLLAWLSPYVPDAASGSDQRFQTGMRADEGSDA
ncbi:glycosyltransferase [Microbacter sp. GSS18]|nr:glycosyltransferase [Microbacter sp. GSS18]